MNEHFHGGLNTHNSRNLLGFSAWRMPAKGEVEQIFYGWKGRNVAEWAISQGYPKDYLRGDVRIMLTNQPALGKILKGLESWWYSLNNGAFGLNRCRKKYQYYARKGDHRYSVHCIIYPSSSLNPVAEGYLIPVRRPADNEIYYY